jgi:hypothetical protein
MAHPDIDKLLNLLLPLAKQMLANTGSFYPLAAGLAAGGMPTMIPAPRAEGDPSIEQVLDGFMAALRAKAEAGEITAGALCLDAWVALPDSGEKSDAIELRIEHVSGDAVRIFLPYALEFEKEPRYGELFAAVWGGGIF